MSEQNDKTSAPAKTLGLGMIYWLGIFVAVALIATAVWISPGLRPSQNKRDAIQSSDTNTLADQAFLEAVETGNIKSVKLNLTDSLNWKQVATPALATLADHQLLGEPEGQSDDAGFWKQLADLLIKNGADIDAAMSDASDLYSLQFLISNGASPQAINNRLYDFCGNHAWKDGVDLLIKCGANVNMIQPQTGDTPMHESARHGEIKIMERLLLAGAKVNAKNAKGQTPLVCANLTLQTKAAEYLQSKGGKD